MSHAAALKKLHKRLHPRHFAWLGAVVVVAGVAYLGFFGQVDAVQYVRANLPPAKPVLDKAAYNRKLLALAHINIASTTLSTSLGASASSTASTSPLWVVSSTASTSVSVAGHLWPHPAPYPLPGALLPANRIVAYYGNYYSTGMGVLGEYPPEQVLAMLASTTQEWKAADPSTPVIPAIDYIAVTAQASAGADGKYRARMPDSQIQKAIAMAAEVHGIVILDVQVGLSDLPTELPLLAPYLKLPQVHLAIDPEFATATLHSRPGLVIGTFDAKDINYAANFLAQLVKDNNLPPKILVVHRFTEAMVTNYQNITPLPEVQIVMDMDGWGFGAKKINTYHAVIAPEPVEFTGFKLFYKNDLKPPSTGLLTPAQVLSLTPAPSFIQYQ